MTGEVNWNVDVIHLTDNDPPQLPDCPICPVLVKLILNVPRLAIIPSTFFEHMPMLEVLDLSNTNIVSLPTSISNLKLLREFSLRDCSALMEIPTQIGMLSKLKLLDVKGTELMSIPTEVGKLVDLEVLHVSLSQYAKDYVREVNETVIPRNMISELKKLKELCIIICVGAEPEWWEEEVKYLQKELCHLQNLETLTWYLPTTEALLQFLALENLEKGHVLIYANLSNFMLTIGQHAQVTSCLPHGLEKKFEEFEKCLKLINAEGSMDGISKIMARAEALFLSRHWTLKTLSTFNVTKLKYCLLAECNELETLVEVDGSPKDLQIRINNGEKVGFEMLEYLSIHYMNRLQSIWKGPIGKDSFSKLRILAFHTCPELTSIFTPNVAQNLLGLKELTVEDCPNVTSVISNESHNNSFGLILPSLVNLFLLDLPELVNISVGRVVLENLSTMMIYSCPQLRDFSNMELPSIKKIIGEDEWWKALDCGNSSWEKVFEKLKEERDLIEQLFEATKSLQHFHDTLSPACSHGLTDMREQVIIHHTSMKERGIFHPPEGVHGGYLDFSQRLEISIDIAHGLTYLHLYPEKQIIHSNVNSSKILLTNRMRAKVADFGFAQLGDSNVKGTVGYLDPEYMRTFILTPKSDVYSFGILLIEILTGRRPFESRRRPEEKVTARWAYGKYNNGEMMDLVDPRMMEAVDKKILKKILNLAFQCAAPNRADRPNMKDVGQQLWEIRMMHLKPEEKSD